MSNERFSRLSAKMLTQRQTAYNTPIFAGQMVAAPIAAMPVMRSAMRTPIRSGVGGFGNFPCGALATFHICISVGTMSRMRMGVNRIVRAMGQLYCPVIAVS